MAEPTTTGSAIGLLAVAAPLYTTFVGHVGDLGGYGYGARLDAFAEHYGQRLARNYARYGPHSSDHVPYGRYVLARQPESLIVWEPLPTVRGRFRLRAAWQASELPESWLQDMAAVWGVAL
ncbi:hypothetical protein [Streptomyces sp. NPDC046939]|uniref:hypothetical protein n=1 Tax=Streptomyces sp. NPDC046939 TaxID=3155376 RepID=UPI0033F4646A